MPTFVNYCYTSLGSLHDIGVTTRLPVQRKLASPVKKSELIRAGVKALAAMSDVAFLAALKAVPAIKTGRPAKIKAG